MQVNERWRRLARPAAVALMVAEILIALGGHGRLQAREDDDSGEHGREPYAIGVWGDLPYSDQQATTGVPNLIADMNRQRLAFTVHDGDLKAGNGTPGSSTVTTCADGLYVQARGYFNALEPP